MASLDVIKREVIESSKELFQGSLWKILLYGSYARGDYDSESDVDMMILLDCDEYVLKNYRKATSRMASRIGLDNDVEVSLLLRDKDSFASRQSISPFYQNVSREGVMIYG